MAEGKSKTGVVKKRASKREKKDWIAAYIFIGDRFKFCVNSKKLT